ncbi:FxsA family protein [Rubellimicrobium arenae]|uniref:FxsA family protein n=1 Tax=Rubellimicrobium arenae TaxID=2817372 RepID=UPI001B301FB8|nr:FxsA family protein [Rubellimicrobium arenae]
MFNARLIVPALVLAEIAGFVIIGRAIGILGTLALVVLATLLGVAILKRQGSEALAQMRGTLRVGQDPRPALLRGGFGLVAALLLVMPGFLSDIVALLLLLPPVQRAVVRHLARKGARVVNLQTRTYGREEMRPRTSQGPILEADWEDVPPPKQPTHRPSGWTRH